MATSLLTVHGDIHLVSTQATTQEGVLHSIQDPGIFSYICLKKSTIHVGKYNITMDGMSIFQFCSGKCSPFGMSNLFSYSVSAVGRVGSGEFLD